MNGWILMVACMTGICAVLLWCCLRLAKETDRQAAHERESCDRARAAHELPRDPWADHHQRLREVGAEVDRQILKLKRLNDELEQFNASLKKRGP